MTDPLLLIMAQAEPPSQLAGVAALISAAAGILSGLAAWKAAQAKNSSRTVAMRQTIIQERLDERDMIGREGGFLIPIGMDPLWLDYYHYRVHENRSRADSSKAVMEKMPVATKQIVSKPLAS